MKGKPLKLIIDLGNSTQKYQFFHGKSSVGEVCMEGSPTADTVEAIISAHGPFASGILSSVVDTGPEVLAFLKHHGGFLIFNHHTPIPIANRYATPETLGPDRLAAAVAGHALFPDDPVLVIDAGTCIKYDFVVDHSYFGGIIAPGLTMQAKALHTFTAKLPFISLEPDAAVPLTGIDTRGSLLSGIINTTLASMEGIIDRYMQLFPGLKVILSGGDSNYFDKRLKYSIFAPPNLVAAGLNEILDFNEKNHP